jgi:acyl carrier protein
VTALKRFSLLFACRVISTKARSAQRIATTTTESDIREIVKRALSNIAPEIDLDAIDPGKDLREQMDIDSVDFLNFVIGLHKELNIEIPDADVAKLTTFNGCVAYLTARLPNPQTARDSTHQSG